MDDFTSANISSTIDKVGDGAVNFYKDGDKAGKEIGGPCWTAAEKILERAIYVIVALTGWMEKEAKSILLVTIYCCGRAKYTEIFQNLPNGAQGIGKIS
ncbi:hypothetical protein BASA81_013926 [Batrachochytrium salamandrivorans]|nr:hypothetical protein BASA81_013926 [Batrachochytrium salamandrivorans]